MYSYLAMAYANIGNAATSAAYVEEYRKRAVAVGVNGPRVNKPRPGTLLPTSPISRRSCCPTGSEQVCLEERHRPWLDGR